MSEWLKIVSTVLKVWFCPVSSLSHHPACVMCQMTYLLCIIIIINLALNIIMTGMSTQLVLFGFLAWQILKVLMN